MTSKVIEIKQFHAARLFEVLNSKMALPSTLTWGEYFNFLNHYKSRTLDKDHNILVQDKAPDARSVKQRRVLVATPSAQEGRGGYIAFSFDENVRDGKVILVKLTIACQDTGRVEHVRITPSIASSHGIYKTLGKHIPRMLNQFVELMHRIDQ